MQQLCVSVCVHRHSSYPEGAVGHVDLSPGDDDGVFNGLNRSVHTEKCAISFVSDRDVDSAAFSVLREHKSMSALEPYAI